MTLARSQRLGGNRTYLAGSAGWTALKRHEERTARPDESH